MSYQMEPLVEYCHLPLLAVVPVIAMPRDGCRLASTSAIVPMKELTDCPASCAAEAFVGATAISDVIAGLAAVSTGASLAFETTIEAVSDESENAVAPPLALVSTFDPAVPDVWSQAR